METKLSSSISQKIDSLFKWAEEKNISMDSLKNVLKMLKTGQRDLRCPADPIQFPEFYYPDSQASAWHLPQKYTWVKQLEDAFPEIKKEAVSIYDQRLMDQHPQNEELVGYGTWNTFFFYKNGQKFNENLKKCPVTAAIIDNIDGTNIAGRVYFSAMTPGVHVKPHCGPHNFKLRTHLGLVTPPEASIRVGDRIEIWKEGKCIVFDDSFEHEVWNKSEDARIVLILDTWNPCLSDEERAALTYLMPEFYHLERDTLLIEN